MWLEREDERKFFCLLDSLQAKCPKLKIEKYDLAMLRTFQNDMNGI